MLYKVTPMMPSPEAEKAKKAKEPGQPRKKRKTAIYDADGHEVLITLMCLKCKSMKPLAQFGLRKMADGAIRNQPWCRTCRGGAGTKKKTPQGEVISSVPSDLDAHTEPVSPEHEIPVSAEHAIDTAVDAQAIAAEQSEQAEPAQSGASDADADEIDAAPVTVEPLAAVVEGLQAAPSLSDEEPTHPGESVSPAPI